MTISYGQNVAGALQSGTAALQEVSNTARLDAEILMAHALGLTRAEMLMRQRDLQVPECFAKLVARRATSEPVAYIRGFQEFWDLTLAVTPDVLIPRADSETVIEVAIDAFAGNYGPARVLDLGTGSGALLLAALSVFPDASGVGVDASAAALSIASRNAEQLGFRDRTEFRRLNWHEMNWTEGIGRFDLIICNPPYVESSAELDATVMLYEPHNALFAGEEGLDDYRILLPRLENLLNRSGIAIFEIGYRQADAVSDLARRAGLSTKLHSDLGGNPRCLRFSLGIAGTGG